MTRIVRRRLVRMALLTAAAAVCFWAERDGVAGIPPGAGRALWRFLALLLSVLAFHQVLAVAIVFFVRWKKGPEGEIRMLTRFVTALNGLVIVAAFLYSLGVLRTIGVVAAGFAGMLLGWSLQAPVSGMAAWALINVMRPFRISDRVLFPSLGLIGDVKRVGLMYTVLNQVGGSVGSEEPIGRDILIPNAMLFGQVAINYTPKAMSAYFLDEVVVRMTYDSDWDTAEQILLKAAHDVTGEIIRETGQEPYIRSDMWDYGILLRLRYMTLAKDRPRITHEIVKRIFKEIQLHPRVDMAIPFVYSFRKGSSAVDRRLFPEPDTAIQEIPVAEIVDSTEGEAEPPAYQSEVAGLMENIRKEGLLQPLVLRPLPDGRYGILVGHLRFKACKRLGWKTIPAVVRGLPEAQAVTGQQEMGFLGNETRRLPDQDEN